jgi:hypothetical protein
VRSTTSEDEEAVMVVSLEDSVVGGGWYFLSFIFDRTLVFVRGLFAESNYEPEKMHTCIPNLKEISM